ncbi:MAG: DM13 domain-containing protein [Pseudomonadota bacterium]
MWKWLGLAISHAGMLAVGFALGVYLLPILTAPESPDAAQIEQSARAAMFSGTFTRDLEGSDFLHWGEGKISITPTQVVHEGALAPGPDYKLYLTTKLVTTEAEFEAIKSQSVRVGDVKTFNGFILDVPADVDVQRFSAVVVWCEAFSEFITAAEYR